MSFHNLSNLGICFGLYIFLMVFYAITYFSLYRANPSRFSFASDVRDSQKSSFESRAKRKILVISKEIEALRILLKRLELGQNPVSLAEQGLDAPLSNRYRFELFLAGMSGAHSAEQVRPTIAIFGNNDVEIARYPLVHRWPWQRWDDLLPRRVNKSALSAPTCSEG